MKKLAIIFTLLFASCAFGQIVNNPINSGPVLPSGCKVTDPSFYKTSALDGKPVGVYLCIQTNLWLFIRNAVGTGIVSLNGATSQNQTIAVGTNGLSPNWVTADPQQVLNIPLARTANVTAGLLSNADYLTFTQKMNLGGDITGTTVTPRVAALQGFAVSTSQPIAGQVMTWNGFEWISQPTQNIPDFQTEPANTILASPCFGSGLPAFRTMCLQDLPTTLVQIGGDLGGFGNAPLVTSVHLNSPLGHDQGGTDLASVTDNAVILGESTVWKSAVIPDCPNGVLQYTAATHTISCVNTFGVMSVVGTAGQIAVVDATNPVLSLVNPLVTPGFTSSATEFDTTSSINVGSSFYLKAANNGGVGFGSGQTIVWGSGLTNSGITGDLGLSRDSAGTLDIGNGTPGNKTGVLNFATLNTTTINATTSNLTTLNSTVLKSTTTNPAQSGNLRLAKTDSICFRNVSNTADICMTEDGSSVLNLPTTTVSGTTTTTFLNVTGGFSSLFAAPVTATAIGNVSIGVTTTNILAKTVTMPATGGPYRAFISWQMPYLSGSFPNTVDGRMTDGTNFWCGVSGVAQASQDAGLSGACFSPVTYSAGQVITFTLQAIGSATSGFALQHSFASFVGADTSFTVVPIPTN